MYRFFGLIGILLVWSGIWVVDPERLATQHRITLQAAAELKVGPPVKVGASGSGYTGRLERITQIHFSPWDLVMAVAWTPDGEMLAVSAGDDIYVYGAKDWKEIIRMPVGALTHSLMFSSDGRWLAAGSRDGFLRFWEYSLLLQEDHREPVRLIQAHRKGVNSIVFSPDGSVLATGGNDAIARYWDPLNGEMKGMTIGGSFAVPSIDFSPDGTVLAIVNGGLIRLREVGTERILGTFKSDTPLYQAVFSPDGKKIAATASDNLIRIWDTDQAFRTGKAAYPEPLLLQAHSGALGTFRALVWKSVFSPDGKMLVTAGGDATIRLWEPDTGSLLATYSAHPRGATCIAFRGDGEMLASGGLDGSLIVWKVAH